MRHSIERILTTHTGSLPRPERLKRLFVARAGGDVGNNGEQQRESFFLYLRDRLTGLGGSWQRPSRADVERYPEFKQRWLEQTSAKGRISPNEGLPEAIGEVRYTNPAAIESECRDFERVLAVHPKAFIE